MPKIVGIKTLITLSNGRELVVFDANLDTLETIAYYVPSVATVRAVTGQVRLSDFTKS